MFDISQKLASIVESIGRSSSLNQREVDASIDKMRSVLIDADISSEAITHIISELSSKMKSAGTSQGVPVSQIVAKNLHDILLEIIGTGSHKMMDEQIRGNVLFVGLQGVGKTASVVKFAHRMKEIGKSVLVCSLDTHRPAAINQLAIMAHAANIDCYPSDLTPNKLPLEIAKEVMEYGNKNGYEVIAFDTAGRSSVQDCMMDEVRNIKTLLVPSEVFLVCDSMMGQGAIELAREFHRAVFITGIILTKADNDTKFGALISLRYALSCPIRFLASGESHRDFLQFDPRRIVGKIIGMGDISSLMERASKELGKEKMDSITSKIKDASIDYNDLVSQFELIFNMGGLGKIISMLPMMGPIKDMISSSGVTNEVMMQYRAAINSMTKRERKNQDVMVTSRIKRVSKGSGVPEALVSKLVELFAKMKHSVGHLSSLAGKDGNISPAKMMEILSKMRGK